VQREIDQDLPLPPLATRNGVVVTGAGFAASSSWS
jgi:hypothetical protein